MKFYGKLLKLRGGKTASLSLLYPCNLACDYCSIDQPAEGKRPRDKGRLDLDGWKRLIRNIDIKCNTHISELFLTGGEPTLIKFLPELVNFALSCGYHVTVFSNLHNVKAFDGINVNGFRYHRFQIDSTFHSRYDNKERFTDAYNAIKDRYRVNVGELGEKHLEFSKMKDWLKMEDFLVKAFRFDPMGNLYDSHYSECKTNAK